MKQLSSVGFFLEFKMYNLTDNSLDNTDKFLKIFQLNISIIFALFSVVLFLLSYISYMLYTTIKNQQALCRDTFCCETSTCIMDNK